MHKKIIFYFSLIISIILITSCSNNDNIKLISGQYYGTQTWSGQKIITGDTVINGDLKILPGTVIKFDVNDDQQKGQEFPADNYNLNDPTRKIDYEQSHSILIIKGKLNSKGTNDNPIIFTSNSKNPKHADWIGISINKDNSIIKNTIIECSRNGMALIGKQENTIIQDNFFNNSFWSAISSGTSGAKIINNEIWNSGHEGIDVQGGNSIIVNNKIYYSHTGIVILNGSPIIANNSMIIVGNDIYIKQNATPKILKNGATYGDVNKNFTYNDFSYQIIGDPLVS